MTAITFVALGTSLPDTFASKAAAVNEKTADNAIGNVTGSNSVNVFMGIGIPWTIAAIYHAINVRFISLLIMCKESLSVIAEPGSRIRGEGWSSLLQRCSLHYLRHPCHLFDHGQEVHPSLWFC